jgi:hypothetical protein
MSYGIAKHKLAIRGQRSDSAEGIRAEYRNRSSAKMNDKNFLIQVNVNL